MAYRVAEIIEGAPADWWRWVPTAHNVADDATRYNQSSQFDPESRWLLGPLWLHEDEKNWPVQPKPSINIDDETEMRKNFVGIVRSERFVDFERFSKYNRLCRAVAWSIRFAVNFSKPQQRRRGELTATEVQHAIKMICRLVQHEMFSEEIFALESGQPVARSSKVFMLKPYLDESGLMRVHGRTDAADDIHLGRDAKRPILLPSNHRFTDLLVIHHHEQMAHQLVDATIASIRVMFWIPSIRALVRKIKNKCLLC